MAKNSETDTLINGLGHLKEIGVDLDLFYCIRILNPFGEVNMQGHATDIIPITPFLNSIGFELDSEFSDKLILNSKFGEFSIVWL